MHFSITGIKEHIKWKSSPWPTVNVLLISEYNRRGPNIPHFQCYVSSLIEIYIRHKKRGRFGGSLISTKRLFLQVPSSNWLCPGPRLERSEMYNWKQWVTVRTGKGKGFIFLRSSGRWVRERGKWERTAFSYQERDTQGSECPNLKALVCTTKFNW